MSLENPGIFEKVTAWPYFKLAATILGLLALIGAVLFTVDRCSTNRDRRDAEQKKQEIVNTATEMANVNAQIANLQLKEAELRGKLERDTEALQDNIFGLEEAKKETNQAIANLNKAVNSNSNVDRTLQDLEDVLRRLEQ